MDAQAFSSVLKKPSLLKKYSISELGKLSQQHPYYSAINALIALKAHQVNDSSYEHYLNQAAIRVPDRKRLFNLIHLEVEEVEQDILEQMKDGKHSKSSIQSTKEIIPPEEVNITEAESLIKITIPDEPIQPELKEEAIEVPKQSEAERDLELPGTEEVAEALRSINKKEDFPEEELQTEPEETQGSVETKNNSLHSFNEWLKLMTQKRAMTTESTVMREIQDSDSKEPIAISQSPQLSEHDEANLTKKARKSLSDDLEWVTETLAKIYELQKKYDKAEEAYKMLSLKYPDKKAYFAQRIENLKGKTSG